MLTVPTVFPQQILNPCNSYTIYLLYQIVPAFDPLDNTANYGNATKMNTLVQNVDNEVIRTLQPNVTETLLVRASPSMAHGW